jgi:FkbM family methyltransferase
MRPSQWLRYWRIRSSLLWSHYAFRQQPLLIACRGVAWIAHCLTRKAARIRIGSARAHLELPPFFALGGSAAAIYLFREKYEPELGYVENRLSNGMAFVDGGANVGIYSVIAAEAVGPIGQVVSFEPSRSAFASLKRNTKQYNQVHVFNAALSDQCGKAPLYHINGATSEYSLTPSNRGNDAYEIVETITIERVCTSLSISRIDFIKLDVEGAEELALHGGGKLFLDSLPVVMFEVRKRPGRSDFNPSGAWLFLEHLGYTFWSIGPDYTMESLRWPPSSQNVIALPPNGKSAH